MTKANVCDKNVSILSQSKLNSFFYGDFYLAYLALFTVFFNCAKIPAIALTFFVLLACFILILFKDFTPFIPLPLFVCLALYDLTFLENPAMMMIFIPVIFSFITHFVLYPVKKLFLGKLVLPIIAVCIALALGGLFSEYMKDYTLGIATIIAIGPVILIAYLLFSQYIQPPENFNVSKYTFSTLTFLGLSSALLLIANHPLPTQNLVINIGWINTNTPASIILLAIPACIYMTLYGKNPIPFVVILVILYYGTIVSGSEAVTGLCFIFAPIIAITVLLNGKLKSKKLAIFKTVVFILAILLVIAFAVATSLGYLDDLLDILFSELSNDSNRTALYQNAVDLFLKYPIFGVGQGYRPENPTINVSPLVTYNFHSTLFHVLATMGIFGVIVYIYYFAKRYQIIVEKNHPENIFAFFAFTMFELYAFVDTGEFNTIPPMLIVTALLAVIEFSNNNPHRRPLPLALSMNFDNVFNSSLKKTAKNSLSTSM